MRAVNVMLAPALYQDTSFDEGFQSEVRGFENKYQALWNAASSEMIFPAQPIDPERQAANEWNVDLLIDKMEARARKYPGTPARRDAWRKQILSLMREFGAGCLGYPDHCLDVIFSREYIEVTKGFVRLAREFDAGIEAEALSQALRNVWVMNCIQMFLGRPPSLSPSVFAYSMLYPCTDNYLDSFEVSPGLKAELNERLGLRLNGELLQPSHRRESDVYRLIDIIENEYPRRYFPEVYSSLLAIHRAQVQSLLQQASACCLDPEELLRISVAKGGASVLADACLVNGELSKTEADFFFGYGVFLQLMDDLQDLRADLDEMRWTIFTRQAGTAVLDALTSRLFNFMHAVLDSTRRFSSPRCAILKDLIRRSSCFLIFRTLAENNRYYSRAYLQEMEKYSPLRFAFLRDRGATVGKKCDEVQENLPRKKNLHSLFDVLL